MDSAGYVGLYTSIALDASGSAHISYLDATYYNNDLKYATNASGSWVIQTVDSVGYYVYSGSTTSIALDASGSAHISYLDGTNGDLKYGTNASGSWVIQTVDSTGYVGLYTSIALDASGSAHISYLDATSNDLKYGTNASGSWVAQTVDSAGDVGLYTSTALDASGSAHISYYDGTNSDLKYATNAASGTLHVWSTPTGARIYIDNADTGYSTDYDFTKNAATYSVRLTKSGYQVWTGSCTVYANQTTNCGGTLTPAPNTGTLHVWSTPTGARIYMDDVDTGYSTDYDFTKNAATYSVRLTKSGYQVWTGSCTVYANQTTNCGENIATPEKWAIETVDSAGYVGWYTSIALDASGSAHISYYDTINRDFKYATDASGSWVIQTVDSAGDVGSYTSIAIDSSGRAHISYYDATDYNYGLKYATNASGAWVIQTVDSAGIVGWYTSLALDASGKAHISYYDYTNKHLKYATNASGAWVIQTVDSAGSYSTSIALDASGSAHISYYDHTYYNYNYGLKYATNASGAWVIQIVDRGIFVGLHTSLALDSSGRAHISYLVYSSYNYNYDLKYATNASGAWVIQTVDSAGYVGSSTSIALDSSGSAHISYLDGTNYDLKYATNASGAWVIQAVDSAGYVGYHISIAIDSSGRAHISYFDNTNYDLKYASNASTGTLHVWSTPTGARIYIDNADTGYSTDYDFTKRAATYSVTLTKSGYQVWTGSCTVYDNQTTNCGGTLTPGPTGTLHLWSTPTGAQIYIDDVDTGYSTDYDFTKHAATYSVRLTKSGYQDLTGSCTVYANQTTNWGMT